MINLAVINIKEVIKYLVKVTIIIMVVVALTRYFSTYSSSIVNKISDKTFLNCLDETIPGIKTMNKKEYKTDEVEPLKMMLSMEMPMIDSIKKENLQMAKEENIKIEEKNDNIEEEPQVEKIEEVKTGIETEVLENNVPTKFTDEYNGVKIKNETDNKLTKEILTPNVTVNMKNILIFHTHTCESYTPSEKYSYKQTGNFRTTDRNYSVVRAGRELENYLVPYGYNVIHDESYHDYPSYSGSYSSSLETVEKILKKNENYDIVLDLHRDAIGDNTYAPTVKIGDEYAAQLMFVIGSNGGVDEHKNWQENLKFAVKVQEKANELYPGLFKPIILRNSDYNQFVSKAASIIEVGATGNTLEQCLVSMKYLSKVIRELK